VTATTGTDLFGGGRGRTLGIIGGIAPESTIEYYRLLVSSWRDRTGDGSYPSLLINSVDLKRLLDLVAGPRLEPLTDWLLVEIGRLAAAGADLGLIASNTPHVVFDDLRRGSPIPLVSIVEATADTARAMGLGRVGLFGTRFTMEGRFYPDTFSRAGISLVIPAPQERGWIHDRYMAELVNGIFSPDTRRGLLDIAGRLRERDGIEGLILGGTELPLILREPGESGIPFLDTTRIHVERALDLLLVGERGAP
jgi:aspartate racemase